MNSVSFTGNAGRDAETRFFESGTMVANFTVAIYAGKDKPPVWVPVTAWGKTAEMAADRVRKGSRVGIEGRLNAEEWTDKNSGEKRSKLTVVANRIEVFEQSESSGGSASPTTTNRQAPSAGSPARQPAPIRGGFASDEEIPF